MPKVGPIIVLHNAKRIDPDVADRNCATDRHYVSVVVTEQAIGLRAGVDFAVLLK
jgi:hypothetical protein